MISPDKWYVECYHVKPPPRYLPYAFRNTARLKYKTDKGMLAHMAKCEQKRHNIVHVKPSEEFSNVQLHNESD